MRGSSVESPPRWVCQCLQHGQELGAGRGEHLPQELLRGGARGGDLEQVSYARASLEFERQFYLPMRLKKRLLEDKHAELHSRFVVHRYSLRCDIGGTSVLKLSQLVHFIQRSSSKYLGFVGLTHEVVALGDGDVDIGPQTEITGSEERDGGLHADATPQEVLHYLGGVASPHHLVAEGEAEDEGIVSQPVPVLPTESQLRHHAETREGGEENTSCRLPLKKKSIIQTSLLQPAILTNSKGSFSSITS